MRVVPIGLFLFWLSASAAQVSPLHSRAPKPFSITVDQPAYIGEPIWVHLPAIRPGAIRYAIGASGCNRLELMSDGKPVQRRSLNPRGFGFGVSSGPIPIGSTCIPELLTNPPGNRLPLHVWYPVQQPGVYAVRWVSEWSDVKDGKSVTVSVNSAWTTFTVLQSTAAERERWLSRLLASPPADPELLLGDYIHSLVAATPDERALQAIVAQIYSSNQSVAWLAACALMYFPENRVKDVIFESILKRGPTEVLAQLVTTNAFDLDSDPERRAQMTRSCFEYLRSSDPAKAAGAIKMIRYTVHLPHQPPVDLKLSALADQKILEAAPAIIAANHDDPERELSLYLGLYEGPEAHPLLWRIVYSGGSAADQARHALLFHPQSDELPKLAAQLMQPGNSDPYGMNLASLPKGLIVAFGDKAVPVLEAAVRDSPYVWVRTNSAAELLRKNDPAAFRFFLDAIVNNRWSANVAYKGQLLQHVKEAFPAELSNAASQKAVADFLRARLRQETGGF
ncbi:MAG: hypothetical protein QOE55_7098 [Acidobacteriaceae bacterium]|nr:hypothetical protein [Acidobacteriaceae bacterium]